MDPSARNGERLRNPLYIYILARVSANGKLPNEVVGDWTPNSTAPTLVGAERRTVPKAWMDLRLALPSQRSNHRGTIIFSDPVNPLPLLHRHLSQPTRLQISCHPPSLPLWA